MSCNFFARRSFHCDHSLKLLAIIGKRICVYVSNKLLICRTVYSGVSLPGTCVTRISQRTRRDSRSISAQAHAVRAISENSALRAVSLRNSAKRDPRLNSSMSLIKQLFH